MSNNQTVTNQTTNSHPWKDWKTELGFFIQINNYLGSKNMSFVEVMDRIIDKTKTSLELGDLKDIVVSYRIPFSCLVCSIL